MSGSGRSQSRNSLQDRVNSSGQRDARRRDVNVAEQAAAAAGSQCKCKGTSELIWTGRLGAPLGGDPASVQPADNSQTGTRSSSSPATFPSPPLPRHGELSAAARPGAVRLGRARHGQGPARQSEAGKAGQSWAKLGKAGQSRARCGQVCAGPFCKQVSKQWRGGSRAEPLLSSASERPKH